MVNLSASPTTDLGGMCLGISYIIPGYFHYFCSNYKHASGVLSQSVLGIVFSRIETLLWLLLISWVPHVHLVKKKSIKLWYSNYTNERSLEKKYMKTFIAVFCYLKVICAEKIIESRSCMNILFLCSIVTVIGMPLQGYTVVIIIWFVVIQK